MFYLKKCNFEDCTRGGVVALNEGSKYCNLHEGKKGDPEKNGNGGRDDEGKFIKKNKKDNNDE